MATPGYPQMGQMPGPMPMGGPSMMGAPPQMRRPIKRGTSKAVPLVVAAGLAVGVFCGLLFGVGGRPHLAGSKGNNVKKGGAVVEEGQGDPGSAPQGLGATATVTPKTPPPAPAPAPAAVPAPPAPKVAKVIVEIKPEGAAKVAKISVDGQEITGNSTDVPADKKSVKVEVKASGYRSTEQKVDIVEGEEMTLKIDMVRRSSGGNPTVRPPKRIDKPPSNPGGNNSGGLIDI